MAVGYAGQLEQLDEQEKAALEENERYFADQLEAAGAPYEAQKAEVDAWQDQQEELQNERTEFALDQIEQQRQEMQKSFETEQRAAFADWQKQSAQHGVAAEQMAESGMSGSGYAESSKVQMYTAYQRRLAAAKESMDKATVSFDNAMTEARMQNNAALAQIAYEAYEKQMQIVMEQMAAQEDIHAARRQAAAEIGKIFDAEREEITGSEGYKAWQNAQQQSPWLTNPKDMYQSADPTKTININSILELGFGRITGDELNRLVESGQVEAYEDGGEIYYRRAEQKTTGSLFGGQPATAPTSVDGHGKLSSMQGYALQSEDGSSIPLMKAEDGTMWYWNADKYTEYVPSKEEITIDQRSVDSLGYGAISSDRLWSLVESGAVEMYLDGFTMKFKRVKRSSRAARSDRRLTT